MAWESEPNGWSRLLQVETRWRPKDPLPITIASLPTTQKHFDWAARLGDGV